MDYGKAYQEFEPNREPIKVWLPSGGKYVILRLRYYNSFQGALVLKWNGQRKRYYSCGIYRNEEEALAFLRELFKKQGYKCFSYERFPGVFMNETLENDQEENLRKQRKEV